MYSIDDNGAENITLFPVSIFDHQDHKDNQPQVTVWLMAISGPNICVYFQHFPRIWENFMLLKAEMHVVTL